MSSEANNWFSATELSLLGERLVAALPKTMQGCKWRAKKEEWTSREVRGSGGPGGMRTEYQPPADVLAQIHAFLEVNPDFKTKDAAMYKTTPPLKPLHTGVDEHAGQVINDHQHYALDTVYVERYKGVNGAAGPGQLTPHDYVIERVEFNPSEARLGVPVKYLRLIHVKGDSMEPTFYDGDEVFVDIRCDRFDDNAIYVIQQDDLTRIKRVQLRLDGSVAIKSDNDGGFPPEIYSSGEAGSFSIIGKVIPWKFGRFKL